MTLFAAREGEHVKVQVTYGPIVFSVTEDPGHVRHFWGQLGRILDEAEKPPGEGD